MWVTKATDSSQAYFVANLRQNRHFTGMKSSESITMPGLSRYVKAFMGVLTAFFLFMTGCLQF